MSMLDAFFNKGFKGAKCKTLLKLTIPRIKLLRNRREIQLKQMRKDIAKLLENGQEATARIRVEHIIREENMMAAQEILELLCELIAVRLPIIETQRECPLDLKEAISSICFAAPRCSDLPELQQVQMLFAAKYGREFVVAATELMPDSGVNRQIIELLSVRAPSVEAKLKLLKEIAEEHELDWDPAASETEYLKPNEDLLNGPNHIISGSSLPQPKELHEDSISSEHREENDELDSDPGFGSLDPPEVPKASVRTADSPSAPEDFPVLVNHSSSYQSDLSSEHLKSTSASNEEPKEDNPDPSIPLEENKQFQFIPFVASPHTTSSSSKQRDTTPFLDSPIFPPRHSDPAPPLSHTKAEAAVDLQDVLEAAHAAADSAERAAAAARAAASLAEVRISELITKWNRVRTADENEKDGSPEAFDPQGVEVNPTFDQQYSFGHTDHVPPNLFTDNVPKMMDCSLDMKEHSHLPQRSPSLEDDPYFSYPNLFSRQDSRPPHEY